MSPDPRQIERVIADLEALGKVDPDARALLCHELCQNPPDLWPSVAHQFFNGLAFRRQLEGLDSAEALATDGLSMGRRELCQATDLELGEQPQVPGQALEQSVPVPFSADGLRIGSKPIPSLSPDPDTAYRSTRDHHAAYAQDVASAGQRPGDTGKRSQSEGVVAAGFESFDSQGARDWRQALEETIAAIERQTVSTPRTRSELTEHARLRLLRLVAGLREEALEPIPSMDPSMQDFWAKQLFGLDTLLDPTADAMAQAIEAQGHLAQAVTRLRESSPLHVANLAFVTDVENYGTFTPFEKYEFAPGQRVILYAEIENFESQQRESGYYTALKSSYQVFDGSGQRVAEQEFVTNEEYCRNYRRDFFIGYEFSMPKINPGQYVLKLTVTDLNSQKIGQSSIEFSIADSDS